jgi:sulfite reductase (NADPH) flavoprotein alpha-component
LFDLIEVDNANINDIQRWNQALSVITKHELHAMNIEKVFDQWMLSERYVLNPNSVGDPAFNIELTAPHDMTWHAGDIAEIQPANSLIEIQEFLVKYQIPAHAVVESLNLEIEQVLWDKNLRTDIQSFKTLEELLAQLPTLATREYSIASIPAQQRLRLVVRQKRDANNQLGLGSGWLTEFAQLKQEISLRIRTNESFHLIDDNRPIICIGNGTGIAGLMSLLQQRNRQNYTANWLIFGERQREHDFFYQETINAWKNMGTLQRLDLAFSRDQEQRIYVQDILRENAEELKHWIDQGAVIYVCGSIEGMASGVDQALNNILSEEKVDELRQSGRYRRDVY